MNTNLTFASFHFSLFLATFLVFPVILIVLPLGSPRCVFPVVLPRFGVEVLGRPRPGRLSAQQGDTKNFEICLLHVMLLILSMMRFLDLPRVFSMFLILSMMSFLDFPGVFAGF